MESKPHPIILSLIRPPTKAFGGKLYGHLLPEGEGKPIKSHP